MENECWEAKQKGSDSRVRYPLPFDLHLLGLDLHRFEPLLQSRLAPCCVVLMNDPFLCGFVQRTQRFSYRLFREGHFARRDCLIRLLNLGASCYAYDAVTCATTRILADFLQGG